MLMEFLFGPRGPETIAEAIETESKKCRWPSTIYRYCEITDRLLQSFRDKRFYFPKYADLNDPCEGYYDVWFKWDEQAIRDLYRSMRRRPIYDGTQRIVESHYGSAAREAQRIFSNLSEDEHVEMMWHFFKSVGNTENASFKRSQRNIDLENIRIFSLTINSSSPLMCYNYAGRNEGVCLEFHTNEPPFNKISPIIYRDRPFIWNPFGGDQEQTVARMCVKHTDWAAEKEWRVCGHKSELLHGMYQPFEMHILKSITFCRGTSEQNRKELLNILSNAGWKCDIGKTVFTFAEDENRSSYDIIRQGFV